MRRRDSFHSSIDTLEDDVTVHVSQGELVEPLTHPLLLQIGQPGHYTCAYLTDAQALRLAQRIRYYLELKA